MLIELDDDPWWFVVVDVLFRFGECSEAFKLFVCDGALLGLEDCFDDVAGIFFVVVGHVADD